MEKHRVDFRFSAAEEAFRAEVERFIAAEWRPEGSEAADGYLLSHSGHVDTPNRRAFLRKLAEKGYLGMGWPPEYGGTEQPGMFQFLLNETLAYWNTPLIGV